MPTTPEETQLTERLYAATATIDGTDPTAAVLRRGHAVVRRRRTVGTVAALSVLAIAGAVAPHVSGPAHARPNLGASQVHRPESQHHQPKSRSHKTATTVPSCEGIGALHSEVQKLHPVLQTYRDILVSNLDPQQQHLQQLATGGQLETGPGCTLKSLGTKLGWTSAGDPGLGMVDVEVTRDWRHSDVGLAHGGWQPAASVPSGAVSAYVANYSGGTAVAVTRADGTTVALDAADLFGNNSQTAVAGIGLTTDQLLAAAADPGFQLPEA